MTIPPHIDWEPPKSLDGWERRALIHALHQNTRELIIMSAATDRLVASQAALIAAAEALLAKQSPDDTAVLTKLADEADAEAAKLTAAAQPAA